MQIRTDLAMESRELANAGSGVVTETKNYGAIDEIRVTVETDEAAQALEKAKGTYITLTHQEMYNAPADERLLLSQCLSRAIAPLLPHEGDLMVVGLGNRHMTADALGTRVLENLLITRHMKDITPSALHGRLRGVCAVSPGVLGVTGIETAEMVHGIVEHVRPAAVIAIDALAARESSRICTTIQVTDTGIRPGSGVGNHRAGLTQDTLGVPVIAIGVPMVVYAGVIARDVLSLLLQDMGMNREEHQTAMDSLVEKAVRQGIGDMVVTPREVDDMVGRVARILTDGLNLALQNRLSQEEIFALSHDGP